MGSRVEAPEQGTEPAEPYEVIGRFSPGAEYYLAPNEDDGSVELRRIIQIEDPASGVTEPALLEQRAIYDAISETMQASRHGGSLQEIADLMKPAAVAIGNAQRSSDESRLKAFNRKSREKYSG